MLTLSDIFFELIIVNFSIIFIWINPTYIIPNFCRTTLQIYRSIGTTLFYHKWALIWRFKFICSVFSEHDVISKFIVIVNYMFILADVTFINLRLLSLTY